MKSRFLKARILGSLAVVAVLVWVGLYRRLPDPAAAPPPDGTALLFYEALLASPVSGLPSDAQMKTLRPLLSPELDTLIELARHEQLHFIDAYPDEKPPWIEGNLFGSLFEGIHAFSLGKAAVLGDTARAPAYLQYHEGKDTVHWVDTVVLARKGSEWRVADIRFGATWDFKPGASLRDELRSNVSVLRPSP